MTTRFEFRDKTLREILADTSFWPDATLDQWIGDAIREYSIYFSIQAEATIACVAGQRQYTIESSETIRGVLLVEYPAGEDPPRFLERRAIYRTDFFEHDVYELLGDPPSQIIIGRAPIAGQNIKLTLSVSHALPTSDDSALTVPDRHLDVIKQYVMWKAALELEMGEAKDPDTTNMLLSMYGLNTVREERVYRAKLAMLMEAEQGQGAYVGPWKMDGHDPIY